VCRNSRNEFLEHRS